MIESSCFCFLLNEFNLEKSILKKKKNKNENKNQRKFDYNLSRARCYQKLFKFYKGFTLKINHRYYKLINNNTKINLCRMVHSKVY